MRVISHGGFNLCPSEICHPVNTDDPTACAVPDIRPVDFFSYADVPAAAVEAGARIAKEGHLDVGGIEYLEHEGRLVFFDINANSNLRPAIAREFGFDPFERIVDFLSRRAAR